MLEFATSLMSSYTGFMNTAFQGNEFLIGMVTTGLLGYMVFMAKAMPSSIYQFLLKHCTTIVYIDSTQQSYHNLMDNIHSEGAVENSRFLTIQNGRWGHGAPLLQLGGGSQLLWVYGTLCKVTVDVTDLDNTIVHKLHIRFLGRSHYLANLIVDKCKSTINSDKTLVIDLQSGNQSYQPKEFMSSRITTAEDLELFNCVKRFTESESWYKEKDIPYKLGVILSGPPGTGKTSIVRAIAGEFGYDLCTLNSFESFDKVPTDRKCIVLIDELDSAVSCRAPKKKKTIYETMSETVEDDRPIEDEGDVSTDIMSSMNDALVTKALKAMDGACVHEGTIVIGTTNYPERIDPAMKRHGRFGKTIEFKHTTKDTFKRMVKKYYEVDISLKGVVLRRCSPADLQGKFCENVTLQEFLDEFISPEKVIT